MAINITSIKTASNGVWQGDDPLHFAFPLLIIQTTLPFPLLPPQTPSPAQRWDFVGSFCTWPEQKVSPHHIPDMEHPILETVASIGLLFFLFLVGLELDLTSIRRSGKKALAIAAAGITLPFLCGIFVAFVFRKTISGAADVAYGPFLVFTGVALSITAFPVLARILAELKLLTTSVGETAMAAAAFNDVAAWVLLALAVALSGSSAGGSHKSPLISVWVLLSGVGFVAFMMVAVRPLMKWVARRSSSENGSVEEACIAVTLGGVLVSGFMTDLIGIHSIFGAFIFGLAIPKEGEFAGRLIERIEDFVSGLLLPLYFASSGLKTDVAKIHGAKAWGLLALVIGTACIGKITGTFLVAVMNRIPVREALTLGVLMNTKGLVELIVLNIGKEKKVLNDEMFAIFVLMALFTTFMTTPTVMAIYKSPRGGGGGYSPYKHRKLHTSFTADDHKQLRILACLHSHSNVPSIINLIETIRGGTNKYPFKLYILRLVELTERSSSIIMVLRGRRNGLPFLNRLASGANDRVAAAFEAYGQLGRVRVLPMNAISALSTMHEDVCSVAEEKRVAMIILPFHKHGGAGDVAMDQVGPGWRGVNQRVLKEAACSVGILVDRGFGGGHQVRSADVAHGVCVVFFGGPDDREALELAGRMTEHPGVKVDAVRFVEGVEGEVSDGVTLRPSTEKCGEKSYSFSTASIDREREKELDEAAVAEFRRRTEAIAGYVEKSANNIIESVLEIGRSHQYELVVVGKGRFPSTMVAELADRVAEHAELGPIGDILASSGHGVVSSVLIIQQHDVIHADETTVTKVADLPA
ncbi:cation/H+ antiporter 20 [Cinnamomum micranthum f. kanehirae]|uniref:Cation/H+ antiporter 20 n=1 Tax=Cinnamomum micranthum f. kanehirae TaxID=337451 RepID=A0A3S3MNB0_9MAGN|nr:cation/H+ antiporter 20 [Cinnamomum micranthum f. kanehirae]